VREVLALVRGDLLKHQISVRAELAKGLPDVTADRVQLQQVVMNLITNAIDAMKSVKDRQHVLRVTSAIQEGSQDRDEVGDKTGAKDGDHDGNVVRVAIEDTGAGIDPDKADRLFDAFFTTKPHGMGMGLAISRSIIEAHGGRLWVTKGAGHGSVFWFELPEG
jgi:signal transduction histidine kinase